MASGVVDELDATADPLHSGGVFLEARPILGLVVPALVAAAGVTLEISLDGSAWVPLLEADGSTPAVEIAGGAAAFAVSSDDLSPLAGYTGRLQDVPVRVRVALDATQTGHRSFTWLMVA
jgi:hypothetical protein